MDRLWLLVILILIIVIELIKQIIMVERLNKDIDFITEYHNKLLEFMKSKGDDTIYIWLSHNAMKMQEMMGGIGVITCKPPYASYYINDYLVILNGLDEVRNEVFSGYGSSQYFELLRSTLLKFGGMTQLRREEIICLRKNPIKLLTLSIKSIVMLPITLLNELGLLNLKILSWFNNSLIIKFLSGIVALSMIIATTMTIVLGWDDFYQILNELFLN